MDPAELAAVRQLASALGIPVGRKLVASTRLRWQVAWKASRAARQRGFVISRGSIRQWLGRADAVSQVRTQTDESLSVAGQQIGWLLEGEHSNSDEAGLQVLWIILHTYLSEIEPGKAVALAAEWQRAITEQDGASTRARVDCAEQTILRRVETRDAFVPSLARLPALQAAQAQALRDSWPGVERAVELLTSDSQEPAELLTTWVAHAPDWLASVPAHGLSWLGEISAAYGAPRASVAWLDRAIAAGVGPRDYWKGRAALVEWAVDSELARERLNAEPLNHPLPLALKALLLEEYASVVTFLEGWSPSATADQAVAASLTALSKTHLGDRAGAIASLKAVAENDAVSGAELHAAQLILSRAIRNESSNKLADTQQALALALSARNVRRRWRGDSAEAVVMAVRAAALAGDTHGAWRLTQPHPAGEADANESSDSRVVDEAAILAAMTGRYDDARRLQTKVQDRCAQAQIRAVLAEGAGETIEAKSAWREAFDLADDDGRRLQAAFGIAQLGGSLPDLSALRLIAADTVAELEVVAEAFSAQDRMSALQANVHRSRYISLQLSEELAKTGDQAGAESR